MRQDARDPVSTFIAFAAVLFLATVVWVWLLDGVLGAP
jgi:hypothetical protein